MTGEKNPFDETIWDPNNPEQAIEDPMHGPSATFDLLQIPAIPNGDGTYYQPGGYYAFNTNTVDANGQPIIEIASPMLATSRFTRQVGSQLEWLKTFHQDGDAGLARLEAKRQQQRMKENGYTLAFKDTDVCGGGKRLSDCETATEMRDAAHEYADRQTTEQPGDGKMMSELAWLGKKCGECALACSVAIQTYDGLPNGITRFSNTKPLEADFTIEVKDYRKYL
ncbi:MAG: hypothetical protein WAW80_03905 [Candidatus Saccharimonadales bacterium]